MQNACSKNDRPTTTTQNCGQWLSRGGSSGLIGEVDVCRLIAGISNAQTTGRGADYVTRDDAVDDKLHQNVDNLSRQK